MVYSKIYEGPIISAIKGENVLDKVSENSDIYIEPKTVIAEKIFGYDPSLKVEFLSYVSRVNESPVMEAVTNLPL